MPKTHDEQEQTPDQPSTPHQPEPREDEPQEPGVSPLYGSEECVQHVASIELAQGQQIQCGEQQSHPRCERERVEIEDQRIR